MAVVRYTVEQSQCLVVMALIKKLSTVNVKLVLEHVQALRQLDIQINLANCTIINTIMFFQTDLLRLLKILQQICDVLPLIREFIMIIPVEHLCGDYF